MTIYIDDPAIEAMFLDWGEDNGWYMHHGECRKCGATARGSERDVEEWMYEHADEHRNEATVTQGFRKELKWIDCGDAHATFIAPDQFVVGLAEGCDALIPISALGDVRKCLDKLEELIACE